jgi:hypothetical protein
MKRMVFLLALNAVVGLMSTGDALAETPVGTNLESRTVVSVRVSQAEAQNWLPTPWQVNPVPSGPSKDANLNVVFINPWLTLDPDGKPTATPIDRRVALAIPAKHPQTGEATNFVARVYTSNPNGAPGPYKNSVPVSVRAEQALKGANLEPASSSELWEVRDGAGGIIELRLQYQRGIPARVKAEGKPRSAVDANFFRIYRIDQGLDVVKSVPTGIDRVQQYSLRVTMAELRKLFDGSEQLVSVAVLPWYHRQVSLP